MALHVDRRQGPGRARPRPRSWSPAGTRSACCPAAAGASTDAVEHRQVDATDADALTAAARGAAALYNAVNPAYHRWATDWPPVAAALLAAAERTGAVLVTMSTCTSTAARRAR